MRISDWSSDVCSSDLKQKNICFCGETKNDGDFSVVNGERPLNSLPARLISTREAISSTISVRASRSWMKLSGMRSAIGFQFILTDAVLGATALRPIGRASCRERVCQYV